MKKRPWISALIGIGLILIGIVIGVILAFVIKSGGELSAMKTGIPARPVICFIDFFVLS